MTGGINFYILQSVLGGAQSGRKGEYDEKYLSHGYFFE